MRYKRILPMCFVLVAMVMVVGCVAPVQHNTASGKPEVTVSTSDVGAVKAALVSEMIDRGYNNTKEDDYGMVFDRPVDNPILARVLSGSSSTPTVRIAYTLVPKNDGVRVVADVALITNLGSAFETRTEMSQSEVSLGVQEALDALKLRVETSRPL